MRLWWSLSEYSRTPDEKPHSQESNDVTKRDLFMNPSVHIFNFHVSEPLTKQYPSSRTALSIFFLTILIYLLGGGGGAFHQEFHCNKKKYKET